MSNPVGAERRPYHSHLVSMVGEAHFIEYASEQGWHLYRGFDGHTPCDFVADVHDRLIRVEVKRAQCRLVTDTTRYYQAICKFDARRFDFMFVSTPAGRFFIPAEKLPKTYLSISEGKTKYEEYRVG